MKQDNYSPNLEPYLGKPLNSSDLAKLSPIFCVGLSRDDVHKLRNAYMSYLDDFDVKVFGFYNYGVIPTRVGIIPNVIVLRDVEISGSLRKYIRDNKIPVLRVLEHRCPLVQLPNSDYYSGVYETISYEDIGNAKIITSMLELGIRIFNRNRGDNTVMSDFVRDSLHEVLELPITHNSQMLLEHLFS